MSPELKSYLFSQVKNLNLINESDYEPLKKLSLKAQFYVLRVSLEQYSIGKIIPIKNILDQMDSRMIDHADYMAHLIPGFEDKIVKKEIK